MAVTIAAAEARRAAEAREWLQIRDFRQTTRFTRPGVDGDDGARGARRRARSAPPTRSLQIEKDLLDTYQARLIDQPRRSGPGGRARLRRPLRRNDGDRAGYWLAIAPSTRSSAAPRSARATDRDFERSPRPGPPPTSRLRRRARAGRSRPRGLHRGAAHPRGAGQPGQPADPLHRPGAERVRQGHRRRPGHDPLRDAGGGRLLDGVEAAFSDLESRAAETRSRRRSSRSRRTFAELREDVDNAKEGRRGRARRRSSTRPATRRSTDVDGSSPRSGPKSTDEADYDLVDISLDQLEAAVSAGDPQAAEQARLTAYAFFEFGPEIKLRAFDPGLALEIEGLIWYGADGDRPASPS